MNLVLIYGPPAVGKFTVATELASLTGHKLFHNLVTIDCVRSVFDFDDEPFWPLVNEMRLSVIGEAARFNRSLIYTLVYEGEGDGEYLKRLFATVEDKGGRVCLVKLWCSKEVLEERVERESRILMQKLAGVENLRRYLAMHDLFAPIPHRDSLTIDNTHLPPEEVARRIASHYQLPEL